MPAEPPDPHGDILETLRGVLDALRTAAALYPRDATILPAMGHVGAAVALLEVRPTDTKT